MYVTMKTELERNSESFKQTALGAFCKRRYAEAAAEREFDKEVEKMEAAGLRPFKMVDDSSFEICAADESAQVHIEVFEVQEIG